MATSASWQPDRVNAGIGSSHSGTSEPATVIEPSKCYFLEVTPPEIRNRTYDLVFTSGKHEGRIELKGCTPPPKTLLVTCQQICAEAKRVYHTAHQAFWSRNDFTVSLPPSEENPEFLKRYCEVVGRMLHAKDLAHINKLFITLPKAEWTFANGQWNSVMFDPPRPGRRLMLVPEHKKESLREAGFVMPEKLGSRYWQLILNLSEEKAEAAKKLMKKTALIPEELVAFIKALRY